MYPFVKPAYTAMEVEQKKELCSNAYRICSNLSPWTPNTKQTVLDLLSKVMTAFPFIRRDIEPAVDELRRYNPLLVIPCSVVECIRSYFKQFYVIKERKLCLPQIRSDNQIKAKPTISSSASKPTVKAILEETWWVVRVKNDYRICRLTFDRGEYWEMVEYQGVKVHNPQYRFLKSDNRVIYEFKEHITPDMFKAKIEEAVQTRKNALLAQAQEMLLRFDTVLIARHPEKGALVGGVEDEDDRYWYLDTYNEHGEHIFFGDGRWELEKKGRCVVIQILRRK